MMEKKFIRVHNKLVHIDAISYVEFLESGRAMIIAHGLALEKQHIQLDNLETIRLREVLEPMSHNLDGAPWEPVRHNSGLPPLPPPRLALNR